MHAQGGLIGGRYRPIELLGQGGMGTVHRVVDESTGRHLALKQLGGRGAGEDPRGNLRFRREFHAMARLRHPRIVEVYDYGIDDAGPYYTMELLDGHDLKDLGSAPLHEACSYIRDVAAALAFLHARRLVHRDLAPRNIRCTADGRAKLIDFGILATVGVTGEVAGTPPFIAPENVRGLPLDHRTDLFALGALLYWLLTGSNAYPARGIDDLEKVWMQPPAAPSARRAEVPPELDRLVMSLLCLDPLGRPASAAEVIDRIAAAGRLEPAPEIAVAQGYLASAAMVGRRREVEQLRHRVGRAVKGKGSAVLIEAPSGTGKSRLMREIALDAQVAGATVLFATGETAERGPYGLFNDLVRAIVAAVPEEALAAAESRADVIVRIFPEMGQRLGFRKPPRATGDPAEERMRVQREITVWILEVARRRPLVLLADDLQRCDEASAALLAALAREATGQPLLVAVALRTDEGVRAAGPIAAIRDAGMRLRLAGLSAPEVEELVRSLFGDVPNVARLARWVHDQTSGSPLYCMELARHLVDRDVIRYVDGIWVLPPEIQISDSPAGLAQAMDVRVAALGPVARQMAEALAIHGGELPLDLCTRLAGEVDEEQVFSAIDELVQQAVLVGAADTYRFQHDGLREAVLRGLDGDPERTRLLHLRVGEALGAEGPVDPKREAEVGWHLYHGGQAESGARLLERAGRRLYEAQALRDCTAPLEAALTTYQHAGVPEAKFLELEYMLLVAGSLCDPQVGRRRARSAVTAYREYVGAALAYRLGRWVGLRLAFVLGVLFAVLRRALTLPSRRGPPILESLARFFMGLPYACGLDYAFYNIDGLRETVGLAAPIAVFERRIPYAGYLSVSSMLDIRLGHFGPAGRKLRRAVEIVQTDRLIPITDFERRFSEAGLRSLLALMQATQRDPALESQLQAMRDLRVHYYDVVVLVIRVFDHRIRGEEQLARQIEDQLETAALQIGSTWSLDVKLLTYSSLAYALCRDVLGLKHCIELMARRVGEGFRLEPHLALARGEYHRERGEFEASRSALDSALAGLDPVEVFWHPWVLGALAETALATRGFEEAADRARQAIRIGDDPDRLHVIPTLRATRALALAEAGQGDVAGAARRLDEAIVRSSTVGCPALLGAMHEARARVSLLAGDPMSFRLHAAETARTFKPTLNPALVAMSERLAEAGTTPRPAGRFDSIVPAAVTATVTMPSRRTMDLLTGCRGPNERAAKTLDLLVEGTAAAGGYLYLVRDGELELAAPLYGPQAPDDVAAAVRFVIAKARGAGSPASAPPQELESGIWRAIVICARLGDRNPVIGAAAVRQGALPLGKADPAMVEQIARELAESGDVTV